MVVAEEHASRVMETNGDEERQGVTHAEDSPM